MSEQTNDECTQSKHLRADPRSSEELLHVALTTEDEDTEWDAISSLQLRGEQSIFAAAGSLCTSEDSRERRVGVDILGQLGTPSEKFHEGAVTILLDLLEHEHDPLVLSALGMALGHRHDSRIVESLMPLGTHSDEKVRLGVVFGLSGYEDEQAVETLIRLTQDEDVAVRDWATFGLGSQIEVDTPAIRAALLARLDDEDEVTRGEAMVGLALRREERVIEPLRKALEQATTDGVNMMELEAAVATGDPRLDPILAKLRDSWHSNKN